MVCSNCGYALGPDDQYCGGCGAFLSDAPEDEVTDASAPPLPPRPGPPAAMIAAAIAAVLLIALLVVWFLRPDGDQATAGDPAPAGATTAAPTEGGTATGTTTDSASDTATQTPTETPTQTPVPSPIELPGSAQGCNNVGSLVVYRGNTTTSCPFAENVGRAFADLEQPVTGEVTLNDVSSPVTGLDYDLTCEFTTPVRCAGGNDAVVYLAPSS